MVSLECLGDVKNADFKFLDGVTDQHTVKLSPTIDPPFTGAHWQVMDNLDGTYSLASAGNKWGYRYLDGRTQDGFVQLIGDTLPPYTGTRWQID
ncbi:MAG TPA: hypothetical protein DGT23_18705, partial [Micromonosporaceae bacterium]|nr:hypothetical protein [Micromonosporaceae bacterium]